MRIVVSLLLVVLLTSPGNTWPSEAKRSVRVIIRTAPSGATVTLLGSDQAQGLGESGRPLTLAYPEGRDVTLMLRLHLEGYQDCDLSLPRSELQQQANLQIPPDGVIQLVPLTWTAPLRLYASRYGLPIGLAAVALAAFVGGFVVPRRRHGMARQRRLQELVPRSSDPRLGTILGRWLLVRFLGLGGSASVYRAVPLDTLKEEDAVAIKILNPGTLTAELRDRFAAEVRVCKTLNHPNVVRLVDWEQEPVCYLVMELVDGMALRRSIPPQGMVPTDALKILGPLFAGVEYAHQSGVVHRDLKPENVMVSTLGRVKVMDFGIATGPAIAGQVPQTGMGTPGYIAPEVFQSRAADARSDQYALGVIVFELLTGERPFKTDTAPRFSDRLPGPVAHVVERMLSPAPEGRYASVKEAWDALVASIDGIK